MAVPVRQPFAPLDGARLESLTSVKNVHNSITVSSPSKRKAADLLDTIDLENVDPTLLFKRAKSTNSKDLFAKPAYPFIKSASTPILSLFSSNDNEALGLKVPSTPRQSTLSNPKPLHEKLTSLSRDSPLSAPAAGRSPPNPFKRIGILKKRRAATGLTSRLFSLDAALKGTIPSYASIRDAIDVPTAKSSWHFEIHEDTPEQNMTNLLQHSTCRLDISSDEEGLKLQVTRDHRGKENIPPPDDISQISKYPRGAPVVRDGRMEYEKPRVALGDLNVEEFYEAGVDPGELVIVPGDEDDGVVGVGEEQNAPEAFHRVFFEETEAKVKEVDVDVPSSVVLQSVQSQPLGQLHRPRRDVVNPIPASHVAMLT